MDDGDHLPVDPPAYAEFARLSAARRFSEAEALASRMLGQEPAAWAFWKTQLGYVCFLNEEDDAARFERAPLHFSELAARHPDDPDARFWKAYVALVLLDDQDSAREELRALLRIAPHHPYASLVLGGMPGEAGEPVRHLEASLRVIPGNARTLRELWRLLDQMGRRDEAQRWARVLITNPAFVETRFGIMNPYVNGVLAGADHAEAWRAEARRYLTPGGVAPRTKY